MSDYNYHQKCAISDGDIVASVLSGDTNAYAFLVTKYQRKIYSVFVRSIQSQAVAAELAQDVFLKAYEKLTQFSPEKKFSSWLNAIAINTLRDYWRRDGRKSSFTDELDTNYASFDSTIEDQVLNGSIMQVVQQLPVLYREALLLRFRDDLSIQEVAESLGIGISATKMRLKRGIEIVSATVEGENEKK